MVHSVLLGGDQASKPLELVIPNVSTGAPWSLSLVAGLVDPGWTVQGGSHPLRGGGHRLGSVSRVAGTWGFRGLLALLCEHLTQPVEFFAHLLGSLCGSVAGFDGLQLVERLLGALQSCRFCFHGLLSPGRLHELVGEFVQCLGQLLLGLLLLGLEAWLIGAKFRSLLEVVQRLA